MTKARDLANVVSAGGGLSTSQVDLVEQGDLRLQDTTGGQYVALQAPGTVSSSFTLTLPAADGTSGQVLQTNGSGTLSFIDAPSGALVLVDEVNASSSDTVELTGMDSTYKSYMIVASNLVMSSGVDLTFTINQSGSYLTTGYYGNRASRYSGSTTQTNAQIENLANFQFTVNSPAFGSFVMHIFDPAAASQSTQWIIFHTGWSSGTSYQNFSNGAQNTAGATTAIKFDASNQTYTSGNFKLYGIGG